MTTSTDPFDRTMRAWLESLEGDAPAGLSASVVDRARTSGQRAPWLARLDLVVARVPMPSVPATTLRTVVLLLALLLAIVVAALAAGGAQRTFPTLTSHDAAVPSAPGVPAPGVVTAPSPGEPGAWTAGPVAPDVLQDPLVAVALADGDVLATNGLGSAIFDPAAGTWSVAANEVQPRVFPATARLADGRVLVVGGTGFPYAINTDSTTPTAQGEPQRSVEAYDPVSRHWTTFGELTQPIAEGHSATTLLDGRVLIAGGTQYAAVPWTALLRPDGSTETAAPLRQGHAGHTATLLPDGRVLVTGGSIVHTAASATAELYDPDRDAWTLTAPMSSERVGHTATLLDDGSVLVAGGHLAVANDGPSALAERYDPVSGTWSPVAPMLLARFGATATKLADGRVLVAGGYGASGATDEAEVFDPGAGTWTAVAPMPGTHVNGQAVPLPDGSVLVVGGGLSVSGKGTSAELFDPAGAP
jgi:hypothetical protein